MDLSELKGFKVQAGNEEVKERVWKKTIVSKMAFLLGVPDKHFTENGYLGIGYYEELKKDSAAMIIRSLSMLRNSLIKHAGKINHAIRYDMKNLSNLPEYVPQKALQYLDGCGIRIEKANCRPDAYRIAINALIRDRINNCKHLFPDWINWAFIKNLFIMPNGEDKSGIIAALQKFNADWNIYPYHCYWNWPGVSEGTLLSHDQKFVTSLYYANGSEFTDISKLRDAKGSTKSSIRTFLEKSDGAVLLVDCENSDVYRLCAVLNSIETEMDAGKLSEIILYDDFHTTDAWKILNDFTSVKVTRQQIDRIKDSKSLVDQALMLDAARLYYKDGIRSFILATSDSDYGQLMKSFTDAEFFIMVEAEKFGKDIKSLIEDKGIPYCYMNDFNTESTKDLKNKALCKELYPQIRGLVNANISSMMSDARTRLRMDLTPDEETAFMKRLKKDLRLVVDDTGELRIEL